MNKRQYKKALKKAVKGWQLERKEYFRYHMLFRKYLMRAMRHVNAITGYHIEYSTDITFSFNVDHASPEEDKTGNVLIKDGEILVLPDIEYI